MAANFTQFPIETATITERVASNPATLPLAGTETLLIDQGGTTKGATAAAIAATLPEATTTDAGKLSVGDKAKLNSIASNATANASDAELRDRATHTGEQAISTVTGLQTALDGKEAAGAAASAQSAAISAAATDATTKANAAQSAAISAAATDATTKANAAQSAAISAAATDATTKAASAQSAAISAAATDATTKANAAQSAAISAAATDATTKAASAQSAAISAAATDATTKANAAQSAAISAAATDATTKANAAQSAAIAASAPAAQGVTNGNSHDHAGGDGAQIAYGSLSGLPSLTATATATPSGGLSIQDGNLVPGEIIKLFVSDLGETGIATGNSKSEVRIDRAFEVLGVWWNCHPSAMASAGTSEARPYIRTGAGTTSAGTKANLLTSAGNIASLAASVHTVDATSLISGGTYSGSAGDWLGVDIMSIGAGSSGHQLTYLLRYS
jgi:hypothetical protein